MLCKFSQHPVNFARDEIRELQILVVEMKKELKELKSGLSGGLFFFFLIENIKLSFHDINSSYYLAGLITTLG